jgi:hypothetical protein
MKLTRYTKFTGDLSTGFDLEDLMQALSDFLLDSGFRDPFSPFSNLDDSMESLREAIRQALDSGEILDDDAQEQYEQLEEPQVEELIDKIIQRMKDEAYLNAEDPQEGQGQQGDGNGESRFEVTDKAMTSSGTRPCAISLAPSASRRWAATTLATRPPASRPTAPPSSTSSATPSTSTSPLRSTPSSPAKVPPPTPASSTSSTPTSTSSKPTTSHPVPQSSCSTARTP